MKNFRLFFSVLFLLSALIILLLIAVFDTPIFFRAANLIKNYILHTGIAAFILLVLLSAAVVSNLSRSDGSLMSNGYFQLAILEIFLCSAGLVYLRHNTQKTGQIVLQLQPDTIRNYINLGVRYQFNGSAALDTLRAPARLENRPTGNYSFEILDPDIVYFRTDVVLEPAETETLLIPVTLNSKTLTVQTEPAGAEIWMNGLQTSLTPDSFNVLTGDTVILELKMKDYQVYSDTMSLNENVDLGIIPLRKLYTVWISNLYAYTEYKIYDMENNIVFTAENSRKVQLPQGKYRISYEIGEGQYQSKTFLLNFNSTVQIP